MILFGNLFGYFSKNWAIFSKSSGHPATEQQIEEEKMANVNGGNLSFRNKLERLSLNLFNLVKCFIILGLLGRNLKY
jgi:hypothetical protein